MKLLVLLSFLSIMLYPQGNPLDFFPHSLGNMWHYNTIGSFNEVIDVIRTKVVWDSTDGENNLYLKYNSYILEGNSFNYFKTDLYKIDTLKQVWHKNIDYGDYDLFYKLNADLGDMYIVRDSTGNGHEMMRVVGIDSSELFSTPSVIKSYRHYFADSPLDTTGLAVNYYNLSDKFGLIGSGEGDIYFPMIIRGAVIDGILYGDTTVITAVQENEAAGFSYKLSQNYPNPFNPSTVINYTLAHPGVVTIKVYDILGREAAVLKNGYEAAGEHSVKFNASGLADGVYIYKLTAKGFSQSKKMMLLK